MQGRCSTVRCAYNAREVEQEDRRLRLVLCIGDWLTQKEDVVTPWRCIGHQSEVYTLRWELEALTEMGTSLAAVIKSTAWSLANKGVLVRTVTSFYSVSRFRDTHTARRNPIFASLVQAMWPIGLLRTCKIIDNPWSVGMVRADKAGLLLAEALYNRLQGSAASPSSATALAHVSYTRA